MHFTENGNHTFVLSRNMLLNSFYKYPNNDETLAKSFDYNSTEAENKFRYEYNIRKNDIKYNFGANLEYAKYYNKTSQQIFIGGALTNFEYTSNLNVVKYGISAQASKTFFSQKLLVSLGLRTDGNDYNNNSANLLNQISPRISFSYSFSEKMNLNAGTGRYFQQTAYTTLGFRNSSGDLLNYESATYIGRGTANIY